MAEDASALEELALESALERRAVIERAAVVDGHALLPARPAQDRPRTPGPGLTSCPFGQASCQ